MIDIPVFTAQQVRSARSYPKRMTEPVLAACLNLPLAALAEWRVNGMGPEHTARVDGTTVYERRHVLHWMHWHEEK